MTGAEHSELLHKLLCNALSQTLPGGQHRGGSDIIVTWVEFGLRFGFVFDKEKT